MRHIFTTLIVCSFVLLYGDALLKTGQVNSYDIDGNIVNDGTVKDDGYYEMGLDKNYDRDGDIVIDHITGLHWQDNESIKKRWITQENYDAGDYNNTDGDTAETYCKKLELQGFTDWRLPNMQELATLLDYTRYPAANGIFNHMEKDVYLSITPFDNDSVWTISFRDAIIHYAYKTSYWYVRCVRGERLEKSTFTRSDTGIVSDLRTKLQWQDNSEVKDNVKSWDDALKYCEELKIDGKHDWRLPNNNELLSILDHTKFPAIDTSIFQNAYLGYHWSSTSFSASPEYAWEIHFYGNSSTSEKSNNTIHTFCVRGGSSSDTGLKVVTAIINYLLD